MITKKTLAKEIKFRLKLYSRSVGKEQTKILIETLYDFAEFCEKNLKIKTKQGKINPFVLNDAQKKFAQTVLEEFLAGKPIRIIILKARQLGFSTVTEALIYYLTSLQEAKNSFIVAQDNDASANLYEMFRLYYDGVSVAIKPMRKLNNAKKLTFENPSKKEAERLANPGLKSQISVNSAEKKVLARSGTIHYLHVSELAFWPKSKKLTHMTSLFQALSSEPGTLSVIESTANGMEEYKEMWDAAVEGENDYKPLFFPWFDMPSYRMPVPEDFKLTEEEEELKERFNLDDEQLQWRRYTIRNDCKNDPRQFRQEYPSVPEEAFLLSGEGIFDNEFIQRKLMDIKNEGEQFEIDYLKKTHYPVKNGTLTIYKKPEEGKRYILSADTAKGKSNGDWDAAYVIEYRTGEMVAKIRGKWDTDKYGKKLDYLGRYYNTALLAVENNNTGESVLNTLNNTCHYPLLYMCKPGDYGWNTNNATRPVMFSDFKEAIRDNLYVVQDKQLYKECLTLIDNNGKEEADEGCHDDCIMAYAIGLQVRLVAQRWFDYYDKKHQNMPSERKRPNRERR
jgi:hypothetical protein